MQKEFTLALDELNIIIDELKSIITHVVKSIEALQKLPLEEVKSTFTIKAKT